MLQVLQGAQKTTDTEAVPHTHDVYGVVCKGLIVDACAHPAKTPVIGMVFELLP
jgi:hypothetical protein